MANYHVPLIRQRFPSYVKRNYRAFEGFLADYFEFLAQKNNVLDYLENYLNNYDNSNEASEFWDVILSDLGYKLDTPITIQKRQFVTFLRDYYAARGSEQGLYFMFKVLFNDEPTITYPREDMLIPSETLHETDNVIFIDLRNVSQTELFVIRDEIANYRLYGEGVTSGTSFSVDRFAIIGDVGRMVVSISDQIIPFETIKLSTGKLIPTLAFLEVSNITTDANKSNGDTFPLTGNRLNGEYRIKRVSTGSIDAVEILDGGTNYAVNDDVIAVGGFKSGFYARVSKVNDTTGAIEEIQIGHKGYYVPSLLPLAVLSVSGTGAKLQSKSNTIGKPVETDCVEQPAVIDSTSYDRQFNVNGMTVDTVSKAVFKTQPKQKTPTGVLEVQSILTDSYYYQQFSYRVNSHIPRAEYIHHAKRDNHPVGYVLLSRLLSDYRMKKKITVKSTVSID